MWRGVGDGGGGCLFLSLSPSLSVSLFLFFGRGPHTKGHLVTFKLSGCLQPANRRWSICSRSVLSERICSSLLWLTHLQRFASIISQLLTDVTSENKPVRPTSLFGWKLASKVSRTKLAALLSCYRNHSAASVGRMRMPGLCSRGWCERKVKVFQPRRSGKQWGNSSWRAGQGRHWRMGQSRKQIRVQHYSCWRVI